MHEVNTRSHYGAHLALDQCPSCGGLWFDDLELYLGNERGGRQVKQLPGGGNASHSLLKNVRDVNRDITAAWENAVAHQLAPLLT